MAKEKKSTINVQGLAVTIISQSQDDYISITDIARLRDTERSDYILQNWMSNRSTIDFIGLWEQLRNPHFNSIEFDGIKNMVHLGLPQGERLRKLNTIAIQQLKPLVGNSNLKQLGHGN